LQRDPELLFFQFAWFGTGGAKSAMRFGWFIAICIIAAFLSLGLERVKGTSYRLVCGSNLSALGKSFMAYMNDNKGKLPDIHTWCDDLMQFGAQKRNFVCKHPGRPDSHSYAINKYIRGYGATLPAATVVVFEANSPGKNASGGEELVFAKHGDGAHFLFADMHVEYVKKINFRRLKWKP
jgi:prepilin-type processing-associated H-X9-DG protein